MEKKKFKFNIIDVIILLLIVCVVVFAALKFYDGGQIQEATALDRVRICYYEEECADYVIACTEVGDPVYDASSAQDMGVVTAIETGESIGYEISLDNGQDIPIVRDGYSSVLITTETYGTITDHGVVVNGVIYAAGHTLVLYAGDGKYYLQVYSVEKLD